jgi:hypothetical protein
MRLAVAVLTLAVSLPARGEGGPFGSPGHPVTADAAAPAAPRDAAPRDARPAPFPVQAYRRLAGFQGPRCPHRPSCSAYAAEAVHRHGTLLGGLLGVARLLRGTRSSALRPLDRAPDGGLLDPLDDTAFFLDGRR